ncbi:MAG: hypothetical protein Q8L65_03400 [Burkholderiales bacterium]|nr:hypothetical protein [Burkholderiales bacterium]
MQNAANGRRTVAILAECGDIDAWSAGCAGTILLLVSAPFGMNVSTRDFSSSCGGALRGKKLAPGMINMQHMPERYSAAFGAQLNDMLQIEARSAQNNDRVTPRRQHH